MVDAFGTDLCLHHDPTDWTLFPLASVAKRWESGEDGWITGFVQWAIDGLPPAAR